MVRIQESDDCRKTDPHSSELVLKGTINMLMWLKPRSALGYESQMHPGDSSKVLVTWFVANQVEISHSCPHSSIVLLNNQTLFAYMSLREMKSIWPREWAQARDGRKDRNTISSGQKTMEMFPLIPTGSESAAATNFPPKWTSICLKESCKCWNLLQNKPVLYYAAPWFPAFLPLNSLVSHFWALGFASEKCIHFHF